MDQNGSQQSLAMGSSRWNPTAEQLLALEEIYRCGTRTPTADQIQQIAAQLRRFGKIEGKNVFYWFQNHKARERQKRRREVLQKHHTTESLSKKESVFRRRTIQEVDQTTNLWVPHNSKSSEHAQGHVAVHEGAEIAKSRASYGWWSVIEERELLRQKTSSGSLHMHATWQATSTRSKSFMKKPTSWAPGSDDDRSHEIREVQTLQLFPLGIKGDCNNNVGIKDDVRKVPICRTINTNLSPDQFFEFLPLKN